MKTRPIHKRLLLSAIAVSFFIASTACGKESSKLNIVTNEVELPRDEQFTPHSYSTMLSEVKPAVVSVYTANIVRVVRSNGMSPQDQMLRRFFGLPMPPNGYGGQPEVEERKLPQGIGSGVVLTSDGYIITNSHVVSNERGQDADEILVRLNDGRELSAELVGRDPKTDVALLKVGATDLPTIEVADSDSIEVGDIVFAIGNPMQIGLTVTQGIVSATDRSIGIYGAEGYENFIQTDASINPGNSGGALVDTLGRLVGINSAIVSRSGGSIGIGFAIPSNLAVNVSRQLSSSGEVSRGYLGVSISDVTPDLAEAFGINNEGGVLIDEVQEGFPAEEAGIQRGDIITKVNGREVDSANEFRVRIAQTPPGEEVELTLIRDGKEKTLNASVGSRDASVAASGELFEGIFTEVVSPELRESMNLPDTVSGLAVTEVDASSPYARFFRKGMAIMEVNDREFDSFPEALDLLRPGVNKLYIYDRGRVGYIAVRN
ncbi:MAG: Do family serine endopeptidase [Opitutaceae bacterium]